METIEKKRAWSKLPVTFPIAKYAHKRPFLNDPSSGHF